MPRAGRFVAFHPERDEQLRRRFHQGKYLARGERRGGVIQGFLV